MLVNNGYKIKVFNTVDFSRSMKYNPFSFIRCEADIKVFVDLFISGTKEKGEQSADKFWENAERLLYMALVGYLYFFADPEHRNFAELSRLINLMEVREDDENFKNDVDYMFEEIELGSVAFAEKYNLEKPADEDIIPSEPNNFAVDQYKKYKLAAAKTAKSILISCGVRLAPFDIDVVREMTKYDEMELDKIGDEKTALFIIIDDKISSFNFLCAIMYSQLFKDLCDKADNVYHGRLPIHVRCILDEFPNVGQIPDFERIIAVIRSREISANVIVQNPAQIKKLYGENAKTIEGCCDSILFLGSSESEVNKYISDKVGKTTIDHRGTSTSKGQSGSYSVSDQIISRELITPAEVGLLPNDECILFIRGIRPFKSKKIRLDKCRNHQQLADFNSDMYFDIKKYNKVMKERKEAEEKAKNGFFDDDSIASAEKKPKMEILDIFDAESKSSGGKNSDGA
ncbi:MAG: type IV secretory system conjugative DNA transfer family protein [Clostridiales bacterium]|nr:type IV secretory system conjugative DNA transfer family protein [Clostridiales bacterium]